MAKQLNTTAEVIAELGGIHAVARLLGFNDVRRVCNWQGKTGPKKFPADTYVALNRALEKRGKRAPASLWGMKELVAS